MVDESRRRIPPANSHLKSCRHQLATPTTANVSALPSSGGYSVAGPITLVAVLVLKGSGAAALALLRRGAS
jgi:hypothetical protein